jgi:menaquinone-dependent protoporphyrinogen oxidase
MTTLIIYSTTEGQTRKIAEFMATQLREAGQAARLTPVEGAWQHSFFPVPDAVIVAAAIHMGEHDAAVTQFVSEHRVQLDALPSAFVSVSLSVATEETRLTAEGYLKAFLEKTGWQPSVAGVVSGALRYSEYGLFKRIAIRQIARKHGLPTDTSRDYEYTDWAAVRALTLDLEKAVGELTHA